MCDPVSITSLAITVASTAASIKGQRDQASAERDYQVAQGRETNKVANRQLSQLSIRQAQEQEAAAIEKLRADRMTTRESSTSRVALEESGIGGNAASQILRDLTQQGGLYTAALDRQLKITNSSISDQREGVVTQAGYDHARNARPIAGPDYFGAAAKIGAAGIDAYDRHQALKD